MPCVVALNAADLENIVGGVVKMDSFGYIYEKKDGTVARSMYFYYAVKNDKDSTRDSFTGLYTAHGGEFDGRTPIIRIEH